MQRILINVLLLIFCGSSLFASTADKKTTRYIIERIVQQPECSPENRKLCLNKDMQQESDRLIKKYAPILPTFAAIQTNSACIYTAQTQSKKTIAGLSYKEVSILCIGCKYNPTVFHIPLKTPIKKCQQSLFQKIDQPALTQQAKSFGFDTKKGMYIECSSCQATDFVTTEDPSKLTLKTEKESKNDDDEFDV